MHSPPARCPDENTLVAYSEGRLDETGREQVDHHISGCELCAELVADAARLSSADEHPTVVEQDGRAADSMVTTGFRRGDRIGRYVILEPLGRGAMGVVFTAYDPKLERAVALKVLRPELDDCGPAKANSRLRREAQAAAQLRHPNVVTIYESDEVDDVSYIAMERIEGDNLRHWLTAETRSQREILQVFSQAGMGLAAAHRANILHRDFKPDNVLVDLQGRAKVVDFGLAKAGDGEPLEDTSEMNLEGSGLSGTVLTQTGVVLGTPVYMAPEQHMGQPVGARADQYAWCVALWEALHGTRPFAASSLRDLAVAKRRMQLSGGRRRVPRWLHTALVRGLSADPNDRFSSMDVLLSLLDRRPRTQRAVGFATVAVSSLAVIGTAAFFSGRAQRSEQTATCDAVQVDEVWNETRRDKLRATFEDTSVAYASSSADAVIRELDRWRERWRDARLEVCETHDPNDPASVERFELRSRCLERAAGAAGALLNELEQVDPALIQQAPRMVSGLASPDECLRSTAQLQLAMSLSDDPERQAQLDAADDLLLESWALAQAARYVKAREVADQALERANELDDGALRARSLYQIGNVSDRLGEFDESADYLRKAASESEQTGLDQVAAESLITLVYVVGAAKAETDHSLLLADLARAKVGRIGGDRKLLRQLENNLAAVAFTASDVDGALEHQRQSLALATEVFDDDSLELAINRDNLAALLLAAGKTQEAIDVGTESLADAKRILGPDHPQLAQMNGNLSSAHYSKGNYEQALDHADESIRLLEQLDAPSPFLAHAHNNRGNILGELDRRQEASEALETALEIHEQLFGPDHPNVAMALDNLASIERALGKPELAKPRHERALEIRLAAGPDNPRAFFSHFGIGLAALELDDLQTARTHLDAALAAYDKGVNDPIARAEASFGLVQVYEREGESKRALELARATRDALPPDRPDESIVAQLDAWLEGR